MLAAMRGIVPAVITPFREDEVVNYKAWQQHIDMLVENGVHGLFVLGGQGEFFALNEEEREVAARFCAQQAAKRVPVYANVGCVTTRDTVRLAQKAEGDGVSAAVVVTPYYIRPSEDELAEHFIEVASSVRIPVLAYTVPERTGVDVTPAILRRVAEECDNFAGIIESSGDVEEVPEYVGTGLRVFVGRDLVGLEGLRRGCAGVVSACANVAPRAFVEMYDAHKAGDAARADRMQGLIEPLRRAFALGTFPVIVKEAMNLIGLAGGRCRRPVGSLNAAQRAQLEEALEPLKLAGYLPPPVRTRRAKGA